MSNIKKKNKKTKKQNRKTKKQPKNKGGGSLLVAHEEDAVTSLVLCTCM